MHSLLALINNKFTKIIDTTCLRFRPTAVQPYYRGGRKHTNVGTRIYVSIFPRRELYSFLVNQYSEKSSEKEMIIGEIELYFPNHWHCVTQQF